MNINEAVEKLKIGETINEVNCRTGWYNLFGEIICFACNGEYPCCHYDMTLEEFIKDFADIQFEVMN